jgi:excinuclease UvrABC nuclease subunit
MTDEPEASVSYTVKELLQQLNNRIDAFMTLLGSKADQSSVAHVNERVDQLEPRVTTLEQHRASQLNHSTAKREFQRWAIPVALSLATVAVMLMQVFHL